MDCECNCLVVYKPNGACFRRHSCNPSQFQTDTSFSVYMKNEHNSGCSNFEDLGFDTTCAGIQLQSKTATNLGSLEACKNLCSTLSFECKGIEYLSSCDDTANDACKIFTTTIDNGQPIAGPDPQTKHYQCLKYIGPVGNSDSLMVGMSMTIDGIDGATLIQNQAAANELEQSITEAVAAQTTLIEPSHVIVELGSGSLIVNIQVMVETASNFLDIQQAMKNNEVALQNDIVGRINSLTALDQYKNAGTSIAVTSSAFNLTQPHPTTTETTITTTASTATQTTRLEVSQAHQIC